MYDICMPLNFTFMAVHLIFFFVNGMMIFLAYKSGFESQYNIYAGYRRIPFCLWHIDVGLHTFIHESLFMT